MTFARKIAVVFAVAFGVTALAWAQMGGGMGQAPHIPGLFHPEVGSGAQYQISQEGQTMNWAYAVVGKESVEGAEGYWLEMRMEGGKGSGMIMKSLMVPHEGAPEIKRMIMQPPGQQAMEMPMSMMGPMMHRAQQAPSAKPGDLGEKLGTEVVTVPAGTFICEHYRTKSAGTPTDLWISTKVAPYGLVKMTSSDTTMVLEKVLTDQTSQIKGEPQKMEMPHF
jgi:hypothetical protein